MSDLRKKLIKLAYENPAIRSHLLPLLKKTASGNWTEIIDWASDPANMKKPATPQDLAQLKNLVRGFSGMISTYTVENAHKFEFSQITFGKERTYLDSQTEERYNPSGSNDPQRERSRTIDVEISVPSSAIVALEIEIPMPLLHKLLLEHLDDVGVPFDVRILLDLLKRNPHVVADLIDEVGKVYNRLELREYEDVKLPQAVVRRILDDCQEYVEDEYDNVFPWIDSKEPVEAEIWAGGNDVSVIVTFNVKIGADAD
jgi:hypothetical protein